MVDVIVDVMVDVELWQGFDRALCRASIELRLEFAGLYAELR